MLKKTAMYLDYAERQARRGNIMYMRDWVSRLDAFLQFNEEDVLQNKGKVTAAIAKVRKLEKAAYSRRASHRLSRWS